MVGAGVLLLRVAVPEAERAPEPEPARAARGRPRPHRRRRHRPAAPLRPTDGALWAGRSDGAADRRSGLWRQT